jgi:hypothetical protein
MTAPSSVGSIELSTASERSSGIRGSRTRNEAVIPAASAPMWRSDGSSVYQAVGRAAAMRAASVDFPNPAPPATIEPALVPSSSRASSSGRASVPIGSVGGSSFADRSRPRAVTSRARRRRPGCFGRRLPDGVGVGGHRIPCELSQWYGPPAAAAIARPMRPDAHQDGQGLQSAKRLDI